MSRRFSTSSGFLLLLFLLISVRTHAQHATTSPAFDAAAGDAKRFQLAPGLKLDVWAAEPQLSNSVAFAFDGRGRVYLAESDRWAISVFDITAHTNWLWQDMSFRNVADRGAFLTNQFATNLAFLTKDSEVIRRLEDRDGDGRADHSEIIATGFTNAVDGTAAGVLATREGIYFANIPSLWLLSTNAGQKAGGPESLNETPSGLPAPGPAGLPPPPRHPSPVTRHLLATGFGVHIGVSGHDLHGLIKGPDGRIYMSFGDRGCVLTNREGVVISLPDTGGVLRCEPDGRNLEVFCYGLRNPQELAFDDFGNLWTVDNDTAGADPCRVLHLVEGGDYGWRTSYQHMDGFGPWVQEELWKGGQDGILPPAGTVSQGPSGLAFYPGTGFGERLAGTFLHADFPGGVWAYTVKPQGASYVVDRKEKFLWNCWPTDVDFGPDGAAYVLDWVSGWGQTPRGRIYRITPNSELGTRDSELVAETRRLLAEGMTQRGEKELLELLGHADRRVRLEAQWELFSKYFRSKLSQNLYDGLLEVLLKGENRSQKLHVIWFIRQNQNYGRKEISDEFLRLIDDKDEEIRSQALLAIGDWTPSDGLGPLNELLKTSKDRELWSTVAALTQIESGPGFTGSRPGALRSLLERQLGGRGSTVSKFFRHLDENSWAKTPVLVEAIQASWMQAIVDGRMDDPLLKDAAANWALSRAVSQWGKAPFHKGVEHLRDYARHPDTRVRQAALLAARKHLTWMHIHPPNPRPLRSGEIDKWDDVRGFSPEMTAIVTNFLSDSDPRLIVAAGRAIHDVPIVEGFPALAAFITKIDCPTNLMSRVINACHRLGTQQHAQMLAGFAAREDVPDWARVLALRALADWERPSPLDRVNGLWRPLVTESTGRSRREEAQTSPARNQSTSPGNDQSLVTSAPTNPLLERAAQAQAARNLGRAAEIPVLPADLGRSVSYDEAMALRRNPAPAQRAFLRVAGDLMNPFNLNEAGQPAGTREVLPLQIAVAEAAAKLRVKEAGTPLFEKFARTNTAPELRRAILPALAELRSPLTGEAVKLALADLDARLRATALPYLDRLEGDSVELLVSLIEGPPSPRPSPPGRGGNAVSVEAQALAQAQTNLSPSPGGEGRGEGGRATHIPLAQAALSALVKLPGAKADEVVRTLFSQLEAGQLPRELALDVREAARTRGLAAQRAALPELLVGGNAERGRQVFFLNQTVQCLRCHKVGTEGGIVGPDLTGIGKRQPREYLLESMIQPNAKIAAGFENVVLTLNDGSTIAGPLKTEGDTELSVEVSGEDGVASLTKVAKSRIKQRERGPSAMPEGLADQLTPFELRDLVEYLATLK